MAQLASSQRKRAPDFSRGARSQLVTASLAVLSQPTVEFLVLHAASGELSLT